MLVLRQRYDDEPKIAILQWKSIAKTIQNNYFSQTFIDVFLKGHIFFKPL